MFRIYTTSTDKMFVIYLPKLGSRYLSNRLKNVDYTEKPLDTENFKDYFIGNGGGDCINLKDMHDFINGTIEKDVIIVYRNPLSKFMTGLSQDFQVTLCDREVFNPLLKLLIISNYDFNIDSEYNQYVISHMADSNREGQEPDNKAHWIIKENRYSNLLRNLFKHFIKDIIRSGSIDSTHRSQWMWKVNEILSNPKINLNKLTLVNLDNEDHNYGELITRYHGDENVDVPNSMQNKHYNNIASEIINENPELQSSITLSHSADMYFYHKLLQHKCNYIKQE